MRRPHPRFDEARNAWVTRAGGQLKILAKGPANAETESAAWDAFYVHMAKLGQPVETAALPQITLGELCDRYGEWLKREVAADRLPDPRPRRGLWRSGISLLESLGVEEVITAPRSPWQNPFVERLVGTLRRELLDHVIVLNRDHLMRLLGEFFTYYHTSRTHRALDDNSPIPRRVEGPDEGEVVSLPMVGGLHHRYSRAA